MTRLRKYSQDELLRQTVMRKDELIHDCLETLANFLIETDNQKALF